MTNDAKPKVTVQPSAEQRRETQQILTEGKAVDEGTLPRAPEQAQQEAPSMDRGNVEPGGAVLKEVRHIGDAGALGDDRTNQTDGRADILPN